MRVAVARPLRRPKTLRRGAACRGRPSGAYNPLDAVIVVRTEHPDRHYRDADLTAPVHRRRHRWIVEIDGDERPLVVDGEPARRYRLAVHMGKYLTCCLVRTHMCMDGESAAREGLAPY